MCFKKLNALRDDALRALLIVITIEINDSALSLVVMVKFFRVVIFNEVVFLARYEETRSLTSIYGFHHIEFLDLELSLF